MKVIYVMSFHELESVNWTGRYKLLYDYMNGSNTQYICCRNVNKVGHFKPFDIRTLPTSLLLLLLLSVLLLSLLIIIIIIIIIIIFIIIIIIIIIVFFSLKFPTGVYFIGYHKRAAASIVRTL